MLLDSSLGGVISSTWRLKTNAGKRMHRHDVVLTDLTYWKCLKLGSRSFSIYNYATMYSLWTFSLLLETDVASHVTSPALLPQHKDNKIDYLSGPSLSDSSDDRH